MELLNQFLMLAVLIASFFIGKWLYKFAPQEVEYGRTGLVSALVVLWIVGCGLLIAISRPAALIAGIIGLVGFFPEKGKPQKKGRFQLVKKGLRAGWIMLLGIVGMLAGELVVVSIAVVCALLDGSLEKW